VFSIGGGKTPPFTIPNKMKRNKDLYEESLPVFYYQRRELREQLEELTQLKIQNQKSFLKKVKK